MNSEISASRGAQARLLTAAEAAANTSHQPPATSHRAQPWYREPWPWILMAGPAAVIVAGVVTIWLAVATSDGLVADDYYRRGLAINQELRRDQAALNLGITAGIEARGGVLRVRLTARGAAPEALFAQLVHSTRAGHDQRLRLPRVAPGVYETGLPALPAGRWRIVLEDPRGEWRIVKEGL